MSTVPIIPPQATQLSPENRPDLLGRTYWLFLNDLAKAARNIATIAESALLLASTNSGAAVAQAAQQLADEARIMAAIRWPQQGQVAMDSAAITVGASPFVYHNENAWAEVVTVSGGTVTLVEISADGVTYRTSGGATNTSAFLFSGAYVRVTYAVAPTMARVF